eukprot:s319_g4.t1
MAAMDIRRSLLDAKLETQTNPGTEKSTTPNISRRSSGRLGTGALTTPSVSRQSSKRQGSIQSVSSGRSSQRSSRLGHGQGGSALGKLGDEPGPPNSARGKRPPGEEVHSRASSKTSTNGGVPRLTVPPRPVVPSLAVPPPASVEAPPTPAPAPGAPGRCRQRRFRAACSTVHRLWIAKQSGSRGSRRRAACARAAELCRAPRVTLAGTRHSHCPGAEFDAFATAIAKIWYDTRARANGSYHLPAVDAAA